MCALYKCTIIIIIIIIITAFTDWKDEPKGGPPLRRDDHGDRQGVWRRDEPPRDRDQELDGPPRDRESGDGWRRGRDDFRDDRGHDGRSRDSAPG